MRVTDKHTDIQTDRQTDILITILRTAPGGEVIGLKQEWPGLKSSYGWLPNNKVPNDFTAVV